MGNCSGKQSANNTITLQPADAPKEPPHDNIMFTDGSSSNLTIIMPSDVVKCEEESKEIVYNEYNCVFNKGPY